LKNTARLNSKVTQVDWLLDRCRTTLNVFGDLVVAIIVEKQLGGGHQPPPEDLQMDEICNSQT